MGSNSSHVSIDGEYVEWNRKFFAEGASRRAYHGTYYDKNNVTRYCVVKLFTNRNDQERYDWKKIDSCYYHADYYAKLFNKDLRSTMPIYFATPKWFRVKKTSLAAFFLNRNNFQSSDILAAEIYLWGNYEKFNSNNGWTKTENGGICQAFSHYSYEKSGHLGLVCDLQGIRKEDECYFLTDPALHSRDKRYGATDLGIKGIENFFFHHSCNEWCKELKLQRRAGKKWFSGVKNTSYSHYCLS